MKDEKGRKAFMRWIKSPAMKKAIREAKGRAARINAENERELQEARERL